MNFPFRNQGGAENPPVIPEMNAPAPPVASGSSVRWGRVAILAISAALVLILLFGAGKWVAHKASNDNPKPQGISSDSSKDTKKTPSASSSKTNESKAASPNAGSSSGTSTSSGSTSGSGLASTGATTALTNTGPGTTLVSTGPADTVIILASTTLAGVIGYQIVLRRKLN